MLILENIEICIIIYDSYVFNLYYKKLKMNLIDEITLKQS